MEINLPLVLRSVKVKFFFAEEFCNSGTIQSHTEKTNKKTKNKTETQSSTCTINSLNECVVNILRLIGHLIPVQELQQF